MAKKKKKAENTPEYVVDITSAPYQTLGDLINLRPGVVLRFYNLTIRVTEENRPYIIEDLRGHWEDFAFIRMVRWLTPGLRSSRLVDFNLLCRLYLTLWKWDHITRER